MNSRFEAYTVLCHESMAEALSRIDANKQGFLIVVDKDDTLLGVLTDGDIRRAIIKGYSTGDSIDGFYMRDAKTVSIHDGFENVIELFKNQKIKFLPVVDDKNRLVNIITKGQMHALLLQDINADLGYDFFSLDVSIIDSEIFPKPWGYYKTTVLNDYYQAKMISLKPGARLSLQSHDHREEHWIVVHGSGTAQLEQSFIPVSCGSTVFIPRGCRHRLTNTDEKESLIIAEVQIGDYFGEDDIIRYEDIYGRKLTGENR